MFRRHAPAVPRQLVVVSRLFRVAPVANGCQIDVIVRAAVFERQNVIHIPVISRPELAPALVAAAASVEKDARPPLSRHAPALVMMERAHTFIALKFACSERHVSIFNAAASRSARNCS